MSNPDLDRLSFGSSAERDCWEIADELEKLLPKVTYKDWHFFVRRHSYRPYLLITIRVRDSHSGKPIGLNHSIVIPDFFSGGFKTQRWLMECIFDVERHEAMELFQVDGVAPYYPDHSPGSNPYKLRENGAAN